VKYIWLIIALLFGVLASHAAGQEAGTVVGVQGVSMLLLADGRQVGILGVDIKGFDREQEARARAWIEVFLLDRTVEFRYSRKTQFGGIAAMPVWNKKDVVGSLIRIGVVRLDASSAPPAALARWQGYAVAAQRAKRGVWNKTAQRVRISPPVQTHVYRQPAFPVLRSALSGS